MQKDKKQILGADGKTLVWVFDGDVDYRPTKGSVNYQYYKDENGKRWKTTPYSQYTSLTNRTLVGGKAQEHRPKYKGVTLSDEFSTFDKWMVWALSQSGFMRRTPDGHIWQLDKDLRFGENRVYSPSTVCFIPIWMNTAIANFDKFGKSARIKYYNRVFDEVFDILDDNILESVISEMGFNYSLDKQDRLDFSVYLEQKQKSDEKRVVLNNFVNIRNWCDLEYPMSHIEFKQGRYYVTIARNSKRVTNKSFENVKEAVYEKVRCRRLLLDTLAEEFSFSEFFYSENFDKLVFEKRKELDELEYLLDNKKIVLKQYVQVDVR